MVFSTKKWNSIRKSEIQYKKVGFNTKSGIQYGKVQLDVKNCWNSVRKSGIQYEKVEFNSKQWNLIKKKGNLIQKK